MSLPNHGANPIYVTRALGMDHPKNVIDFSVNTNPYGPPLSLKQKLENGEWLEAFSSYPDPKVTTLVSELADTLGINPAMLLVGNGAAELIFLLANVFQGKKVTIVEPAFSEYRDACEAYGCHVSSITIPPPWLLTVEDVEPYFGKTDLLFLCTPNNPTGVSYEAEEVRKIIKKAKENEVVVVIDEAFYDFTLSGTNFSNEVSEYSNVIILRSLTKMYAIAGVRLGYVIAAPAYIEKLRQKQPPWSVNGLAQQVGRQVLKELRFVKESVMKISEERQRMQAEIEALGFSFSHSAVNFFLLFEPNRKKMDELMKFLIKNSIVVRHTYNFKGLDGNYLRIAVKTKQENDLLLRALTEWRKQC